MNFRVNIFFGTVQKGRSNGPLNVQLITCKRGTCLSVCPSHRRTRAVADLGGSLGLDKLPLISHHCIKSPSVTFSYQILFRFLSRLKVHHCNIICRRSPPSRGLHSQTPYRGFAPEFHWGPPGESPSQILDPLLSAELIVKWSTLNGS